MYTPIDPYDWSRDDGLDFPDNPRSEPTQDEVNERIAYYETHPRHDDGTRDAS